MFCPKDDGSDDKASIDNLAPGIGFKKLEKNIKFRISSRQSERTGRSSEFTTANHQGTDSSLDSGGFVIILYKYLKNYLAFLEFISENTRYD